MKDGEPKARKPSFKPFPASFLAGAQAILGSVLDLSSTGMLVEVGSANLHAGERLEFSADLPISQTSLRQIRGPVLIIKVYNHTKAVVDKVGQLAAAGGPKAVTTRIIEAHFLQPSQETLQSIDRFLQVAQRKS